MATPPHHPAAYRLAGLDHLRALAILLVFFWHYRQHGAPQWVDAIGLFGWSGVDLFFVLSGYLIGGQLLRQVALHQPVSFSSFYLRRAFRILPAYLVILMLYYTVPAFRERPALSPLWKFLTFTQNFGFDFNVAGAFSHAWSLCIEEQFYLLLPLILMAIIAARALPRAGIMLAVLFVAGFAARCYSWQRFMSPLITIGDMDNEGRIYFEWIYYPTYNRLDGLLAGIGIAALHRFRPVLWQRITSHGNALLAMGIALLTAAWFVCSDLVSFPAAIFGFPLVALAYGVIVVAALSPSCLLYKYPLRISSVIATLAYSIYLTHKQLNHIVRDTLSPLHFADNSVCPFFICLIAAVAGGALLHLAVERPFLLLRAKLLARK